MKSFDYAVLFNKFIFLSRWVVLYFSAHLAFHLKTTKKHFMDNKFTSKVRTLCQVSLLVSYYHRVIFFRNRGNHFAAKAFK